MITTTTGTVIVTVTITMSLTLSLITATFHQWYYCRCCCCNCHVAKRALAAVQGIYRPRQRAGSRPAEGEAFFFRASCFELLKSRTIRCDTVLAVYSTL